VLRCARDTRWHCRLLSDCGEVARPEKSLAREQVRPFSIQTPQKLMENVYNTHPDLCGLFVFFILGKKDAQQVESPKMLRSRGKRVLVQMLGLREAPGLVEGNRAVENLAHHCFRDIAGQMGVSELSEPFGAIEWGQIMTRKVSGIVIQSPSEANDIRDERLHKNCHSGAPRSGEPGIQ
jgi:hypothetical protein